MDNISFCPDLLPAEQGSPLPLNEQDPFELVGIVVPGEPGQLEAMAQALIEEYILLGRNQKQLIALFANPFFLATHRIYLQKGELYIRQLILETYTRWQIPSTQKNEE